MQLCRVDIGTIIIIVRREKRAHNKARWAKRACWSALGLLGTGDAICTCIKRVPLFSPSAGMSH
eukprot:4790380-Amphidinium_carterae.1